MKRSLQPLPPASASQPPASTLVCTRRQFNRGLCSALALGALGAPGAAEMLPSWHMTGKLVPMANEIEREFRAFMDRHHVRAGQLSIGRQGRVLLQRGYTRAKNDFPVVEPDTVFRLASVTKAFTAATIYELVQRGRLSLETKAFEFLGITTPMLPRQHVDPRVHAITVKHLLHNRGGWDSSKVSPELSDKAREIARSLGKHVPLTARELVAAMYGEPLQFAPGSEDHYSNFGWTLLGVIIEQAAGRDYISSVRQWVTDPHQLGEIFPGRTLASFRAPRETIYDAPGMGTSYFNIDHDVQLPVAYGGGFCLEMGPGTTGVVASATTVMKLISRYAVWGYGTRAANFARSGSATGSSSFASSRDDGIDVAFVFNTRDFGDTPDPMGKLNC